MKKYLLISAFLILIFGCKKSNEISTEIKKTKPKEKYQSLVDDKTIYELLNSEGLKQNKRFKNCENVLNRQTAYYIGYDTTLLKKVDTLFSQEDKKFISRQYRNSTFFILNQKLVKGRKVVELDTTKISEKESRIYWDKLLEKYHCIGSFHMPLFNIKKNIAIVEIGYNCGMLCGEGGTYIYKLNRNGKWELYLTIEEWVS